VIGVFITLFLLLAAGVLFRLIPGVPPPETMRRVIGTMVLNIFLPALTFNVLSRAPVSMDLVAIPAIAMVTALGSFAIAWVVYARGLRNKLQPPAIGALLLASTFCNATYLGLPVVSSVVGADYARVPILFDLLGMSIILFTVGTVICVEYGTRGTRHTLAEGIRQVLTLPPFIAAAVGLAVNIAGVTIPEFVMDFTRVAGQVVAPVMLFSIGLALKVPKLSTLPLLTPSLVIKLLVAPAIGYVLIGLLISDAPTARATLLEAAMPTMVLTIVFAERYGLDEELLAQAILFSTIVSMITLPIAAGLW